MPDYKAMYYELLLGTERAIEALNQANRKAFDLYPPANPDYLEALKYVKQESYRVVDSLTASARRAEGIYIETCGPSPEGEPESGPAASAPPTVDR